MFKAFCRTAGNNKGCSNSLENRDVIYNKSTNHSRKDHKHNLHSHSEADVFRFRRGRLSLGWLLIKGVFYIAGFTNTFLAPPAFIIHKETRMCSLKVLNNSLQLCNTRDHRDVQQEQSYSKCKYQGGTTLHLPLPQGSLEQVRAMDLLLSVVKTLQLQTLQLETLQMSPPATATPCNCHRQPANTTPATATPCPEVTCSTFTLTVTEFGPHLILILLSPKCSYKT